MFYISIDNLIKCKYKAFMNEINLTKHASTRCSQRGISALAIETIFKYGHFNYVRGAKSWSMNKREKAFARSDLGDSYKKIEKQLGFLIVSPNGSIVTVAHKIKRLKK